MLLKEARDRLNADLRREYGVGLSDMYEGRVSVQDVSDFAAHLPRGCSVYEWYGGWLAVTAAVEASMRVEHLLKAQLVQASGKKKTIPDPEPPKSIRDVVHRAKQKHDRLAQARADAKAYLG